MPCAPRGVPLSAEGPASLTFDYPTSQQLTGLSFITVALILVLQTGAVPLTASVSTAPSSQEPTAVAQAAPFRTPTCAIATLFFGALAFASWGVGMRFIAFSSGALTCWGVYVTVFGNEVSLRPLYHHP